MDLYTLTNANGMQAGIITYGGTVVSLTAPDRNGKYADVVLGLDDLAGYRKATAFFGALIGRYGNRIGHAQFTLEGQTYKLPANDGVNTLHGGPEGFDKRVWTAVPGAGPDGQTLELTYVSKDGEDGLPRHPHGQGGLHTHRRRTSSRSITPPPPISPPSLNLTNHSYFNLAGQGEGDVLRHEVMINADRFTPGGRRPDPHRRIEARRPARPFDFTKPTAIGARIEANDEQFKFGKGYDHNWVLNKSGDGLTKAAEVTEPKTGRVMEVWTTEPGLQFYTGNFLDGTLTRAKAKTYPRRGAFCMETQHYPDSPNKPAFPTTELKPGATYHTTTLYRFSAR